MRVTGSSIPIQEAATTGSCASVGPFTRLRPGAKLGSHSNIGNFVEAKNVDIGEKVKANHLSYLGDGTIGSESNIGAGTIFCNYDGFHKHRTQIGKESFIGSNTSLVAPVKLGKGVIIGSGSVITKNVPDGTLALERSSQIHKKGWATRFRTMMLRKK